MLNKKEIINIEDYQNLLFKLKERFYANMHRHKNIDWNKAKAKLENNIEKIWSLNEMERTGGEPDIIFYNEKTDEYIFYDCSPETPIGRRNLCYDYEALESRKNNKPQNNAIDMAFSMGIEILTETEYRKLQQLGKFDLKTSSWIKTPKEIRNLGGALFCDRRYNQVFVYHNSAESYYTNRGFRGSLIV